MRTERKLIRNGCIVSIDPAIGVLPQGDILIEGNRIAAVEPDLQAEGAKVIDASTCIVTPGLIDTHRHLWQGAMRAVTADWSLLNYMGGIRMSAAADYRPQDMYAAQYQGGLEALNAGVTTVGDYCHNLISPDHAYEALRGTRDSGLRCVWSFGFNQPPLAQPAFQTFKMRLAFFHQLALQFTSQQIVTLGVAPEEWGLCSEEEGIAQFQAAREVGARIFWHCNAVHHGGAPRNVERLNQLGLIGSDMVLVHMNFTSAEEWQIVGDAGAHIAFTPETELQMGMGWSSTNKVRELGITPTYGADIVSNNSADMFFPLRLALQVARAQQNEQWGGEFYDGVPITCTLGAPLGHARRRARPRTRWNRWFARARQGSRHRAFPNRLADYGRMGPLESGSIYRTAGERGRCRYGLGWRSHREAAWQTDCRCLDCGPPVARST
jgi:cytosine/adenosine deaminase-related metal-dependent hydrolase